jgi:protein-tyrosine phosphatase
MGNICRSPTAEGVFRKLLAERAPDLELRIASAGTHGYHVGQPPDRRAAEAASRRGVDLRNIRARQVSPTDLAEYDYVLAMDRENLAYLERLRTAEARADVGLFLSFAPELGLEDVPDPYYGGATGFEHVLDLVERASEGLLAHLLGAVDRP